MRFRMQVSTLIWCVMDAGLWNGWIGCIILILARCGMGGGLRCLSLRGSQCFISIDTRTVAYNSTKRGRSNDAR